MSVHEEIFSVQDWDQKNGLVIAIQKIVRKRLGMKSFDGLEIKIRLPIEFRSLNAADRVPRPRVPVVSVSGITPEFILERLVATDNVIAVQDLLKIVPGIETSPALRRAVLKDSIRMFQVLYKKENDEMDTQVLIEIASVHGNLEILKELIESDIGQRTALLHPIRKASFHGHEHVLEYFDYIFPEEILISAALGNNHKIIQTLIDRCETLDFEMALEVAAKAGALETVNLILEHYKPQDSVPLFTAICNGHIEVVKKLLKSVPNVPPRDVAYQEAYNNGHKELSLWILTKFE